MACAQPNIFHVTAIKHALSVLFAYAVGDSDYWEQGEQM
jgi:hypothetical protein